MPSPIRYGVFKRKFESFGVDVGKPNKGSHFRMRKTIGGLTINYRVVVHNGKVKFVYLKEARKRFHLTPDDGVSDEAFRKA